MSQRIHYQLSLELILLYLMLIAATNNVCPCFTLVIYETSSTNAHSRNYHKYILTILPSSNKHLKRVKNIFCLALKSLSSVSRIICCSDQMQMYMSSAEDDMFCATRLRLLFHKGVCQTTINCFSLNYFTLISMADLAN